MADGADGGGGVAEAAVPPPAATCLACRAADIEYRCWPCGCAALCPACARKMATGGKCKVCKQLFAELKRINHP